MQLPRDQERQRGEQERDAAAPKSRSSRAPSQNEPLQRCGENRSDLTLDRARRPGPGLGRAHGGRGTSRAARASVRARQARDETCPVSTGRGTRRVQLVREGRGGAHQSSSPSQCTSAAGAGSAGCAPPSAPRCAGRGASSQWRRSAGGDFVKHRELLVWRVILQRPPPPPPVLIGHASSLPPY